MAPVLLVQAGEGSVSFRPLGPTRGAASRCRMPRERARLARGVFGPVQPAPRHAPLTCIRGLPLVLLIPLEGETASAPEWGAPVHLAPPMGRYVSSGVQRRPRSWIRPGSGKAPPRTSATPSQPILQFCGSDRCCWLVVSPRSLF
ncbi:hypothetical protein NDU88_006433 [Pleurodeles waltl]|uniref:Uncharacterized protein n=1 Tax=Pleurodeles waltl TaxID=8319 RepID=A0AAV7LRY2_PLEWA|nr:hypothetical protein NDU88_006433 [Pleurodeles waltl]